MIITIDGPAGSGKSTAARGLARAMGIAYLDTGAMYRAVTLSALRKNVDLGNADALAEIARKMDLKMERADHELCVILDGRDVTRDIRLPEVTENAHFIANCPPVRLVLAQMQRKIGQELDRQTGGVVTEGRDQGSYVFPDAQFKFYLDSRPEVRAQRRHAELVERGVKSDPQEILRNILQRDMRDTSRELAPLVRPADAVAIDNSDMTPDEVMAKLKSLVESRS